MWCLQHSNLQMDLIVPLSQWLANVISVYTTYWCLYMTQRDTYSDKRAVLKLHVILMKRAASNPLIWDRNRICGHVPHVAPAEVPLCFKSRPAEIFVKAEPEIQLDSVRGYRQAAPRAVHVYWVFHYSGICVSWNEGVNCHFVDRLVNIIRH